ncbi:BRO-N domain-containing protein [Streptomyces ginkgonis]|uniref:BRO-N domain-containing protein n=1 Tax=Streptomyces ginkgonis TaxID=1812259 RepID=UPI0021769724|nr:Bro-N domain-containing protein [Streptomyces ginkgonis]
MKEQQPHSRASHRDAIDISDFVYAATGTRIRRLSTPDGEHWFPVTDVLKGLGYTNPAKTLSDHVPAEAQAKLSCLTKTYTLDVPAGHGLKKSMWMVNLAGLLMLVGGATKPSTRPFKAWIVNVVTSVQREGSYRLPTAEVQPALPDAPGTAAAPGTPVAYAMPPQIADAIVRLEERALRSDEALAALQREANASRREMADALRSVADVLDGIRDRLGPGPAAVPGPPPGPRVPRQRAAPRPRGRGAAEELLAGWRARLTITDDVWAVAVLLAPALVADGQVVCSAGDIAARTGLTAARVHDSLRFLVKRHCVRQIGVLREHPVYALY